MRRLRQLRALSAFERRLLAEAIVLLPLTAFALRFAGLRGAQRVLERRRAMRTPSGTPDPSAVSRIVSIAARRGPYRAACLPAALTLQSLLRRCGIAAELRLGVRRSGKGVEAHAWVEHAGIALGPRDDFVAFDRAIVPRR